MESGYEGMDGRGRVGANDRRLIGKKEIIRRDPCRTVWQTRSLACLLLWVVIEGEGWR